MNRMDRNSLGLADRVASVETVIAVAIVERLIAEAFLVGGGQDASSTIQS
jgi:hypothetical protein